MLLSVRIGRCREFFIHFLTRFVGLFDCQFALVDARFAYPKSSSIPFLFAH